MSGGRCQCIRHWNYNGAEQCATQCYGDDDEFCYLCTKYFAGLTTPVDTLMTVNWDGKKKKEGDYVKSVSNVAGTRRVNFR